MRKKKNPVSRISIICAVTAAILLAFTVRMIKLQVIDGSDYRSIGNLSYTKEVTVKAARGEIVDRNGVALAVNRTSYNVILEKAYIDMSQINDIILTAYDIVSKEGGEYCQSIPMTNEQPYTFKAGYETSVSTLKKRLSLQDYATFENVWSALCERYDLTDSKYTKEQIRIIIAVRYEMEIKGFTVSVPYTFAENVSMTTVAQILEKSITYSGISISEESLREYPDGSIAPHIIGTIGPIYAEEYEQLKSKGYKYNDYIGKTGIEKKYEDYLRGQDGIKVIEFDSKGKVIKTEMKKQPIPGNTIVLTIDAKLQKVAQQALEDRILEIAATCAPGKGKEANAGTVVAVDPQTGDVLCAANYPSYNLSTYSQDYSQLAQNEVKPLFNRAFNGAYAPGSTFKPCMGVAGMCSKTTTKYDTVKCSRVYDYLGMTFTCMGTHGNINLTNALKVSCNSYFYDLGRRMGIETIQKYASLFGLGEDTGLELSENIGRMAGPEYRKSVNRSWYPGDVLQASIGQSDSMFSPLQLAVYTGTVGNDGVRMQAHIIEKIVSYNYEEVIYEHQDKVMAVIEDDCGAFAAVKEGMYLVSKQGTGRSAFGNYPIKVGSKTGSPENYGNKAANSIFTAIGPLDDCKLSVAAVVEYGFNGNKSAAIVKKIFDKYFFDPSESKSPALENVLVN